MTNSSHKTMMSSLRLFKAFPVPDLAKTSYDSRINQKTIERGFVFDPYVIGQYYHSTLEDLIHDIDSLYGVNAENLNKTFHKSLEKVAFASKRQLVLEQITHYITTYGFQSVGIFNKDTIYIPHEHIDIPQITEDLKVVVIRGLEEATIHEESMKLATSGVALDKDTVSDVVHLLSEYSVLHRETINMVNNKEIRTGLYDEFNLVPEDPEEFLRYVVYKLTGNTLLIKSKETLYQIAESEKSPDLYLNKYNNQAKLASIFHRYKPIFLALKKSGTESTRTLINQIRKLADRHHKPFIKSPLDTVTERLKNGERINSIALLTQLEKVNTFRKIRLAKSLLYQLQNPDYSLFNIRNGKAYVKETNQVPKHLVNNYSLALSTTMVSIYSDLRNKVEGTKFYLPEGLEYAIPASEKHFTGNIPYGSSVSISDDLVIGVYWEDNGRTIDLDLSLVHESGKKIGWDAGYRDGREGVYYSGDMTAAPNGATEAFHVRSGPESVWSVYLNYYNYLRDDEVNFKVFAGHERPSNFKRNYFFDPNKVLAVSSSKLDRKQKNLGLIMRDTRNTRFFFTESDMGTQNSARNNTVTHQTREALKLKILTDYKYLNLSTLLEESGGVFVDNVQEADVDLSVQAVDKSTFIGLLS